MNLGQRKIHFCAEWRRDVALYDRDWDAAGSLAAAIPQKNGSVTFGWA